MDINEFSIACKLINLKLRGFEIPKGLPPSLLASLKVNTPPSIPPLPNTSPIPPRPEPPKIAPMISQSLVQNTSIIPSQPLLTQAPSTQPLVPNLSSGSISQVPIMGISKTVSGTTPLGGLPSGIMPPASGIMTSVGISAPSSANIPTGKFWSSNIRNKELVTAEILNLSW